MNNEFNETIFVFHDVDKSSIAAIEYVIFKYGNEEWLNAALNKAVTDLFTNSRKNICQIPFIIKKKEFFNNKETILTTNCYHYVIHKIEKYSTKYKK